MNLSKVLFWAAVVCGLVAGIVLVVASIVSRTPIYAVWGVFFIIGTAIVAFTGAKGRPDGKLSPPTIGAVFKEVTSGAWVAIAALFVGSIVLTFVLRT